MAESETKTPSSSESAHATLWTLLEVIVSQGAAFVTFGVIAHLIGPEQLGTFSLAFTLLALVTIVQYYGFADAIVQRSHVDDEYLDTIFWSDVILAFVIIAIAQLAARPLAFLFDSRAIDPLIRVLSFVCLLQALVTVPTALCRRALQNQLLTARTLVASIASGVAGIVAAIAGYGMWALVVSQFVQYLVIVLVLNSRVGWHPRLRFRLALVPELASFAGPFMLANGLRLSVERIGQVAVGFFVGATGVGWYALAVRILSAANGFTNHPIERMTLPVLSRFAGDLPGFADTYRQMILLVNSLWMPVAAGLGIIAPAMIPLVFGRNWSDAGLVLQAMCFTAPTLGLWTLNGQALSALGKPSKFAHLAVVQAVLACVTFPLGAHIGTVAAGFALSAISLVMAPIHLYTISRVCRLRVDLILLDWLRVLIAVFAMLLVTTYIEHQLSSGILFSIISIAAGAITYVLSLDLLLLPGYFRRRIGLLTRHNA